MKTCISYNLDAVLCLHKNASWDIPGATTYYKTIQHRSKEIESKNLRPVNVQPI